MAKGKEKNQKTEGAFFVAFDQSKQLWAIFKRIEVPGAGKDEDTGAPVIKSTTKCEPVTWFPTEKLANAEFEEDYDGVTSEQAKPVLAKDLEKATRNLSEQVEMLRDDVQRLTKIVESKTP